MFAFGLRMPFHSLFFLSQPLAEQIKLMIRIYVFLHHIPIVGLGLRKTPGDLAVILTPDPRCTVSTVLERWTGDDGIQG
jgi:hypothetical protein